MGEGMNPEWDLQNGNVGNKTFLGGEALIQLHVRYVVLVIKCCQLPKGALLLIGLDRRIMNAVGPVATGS